MSEIFDSEIWEISRAGRMMVVAEKWQKEVHLKFHSTDIIDLSICKSHSHFVVQTPSQQLPLIFSLTV